MFFFHLKNRRKRAAFFDKAESILAQKDPLFYYEPIKWHSPQVGKSKTAQGEKESTGLLLFLFVLIGLFPGIRDVPHF